MYVAGKFAVLTSTIEPELFQLLEEEARARRKATGEECSRSSIVREVLWTWAQGRDTK